MKEHKKTGAAHTDANFPLMFITRRKKGRKPRKQAHQKKKKKFLFLHKTLAS